MRLVQHLTLLMLQVLLNRSESHFQIRDLSLLLCTVSFGLFELSPELLGTIVAEQVSRRGALPASTISAQLSSLLSSLYAVLAQQPAVLSICGVGDMGVLTMRVL